MRGKSIAWKRIPKEFAAQLPLFLFTVQLVMSVILVSPLKSFLFCCLTASGLYRDSVILARGKRKVV